MRHRLYEMGAGEPDLFDANYRTGREVTTDLHLINDSWHDAKVHVDLLLTRNVRVHSEANASSAQSARELRFRLEGGFD